MIFRCFPLLFTYYIRDPQGDDNVDHKDYTNKPNSFLNFIKYIEQVKKQKSVDKGNIDNARKNHDDKYKKWFGKKKK